MTGAGDTPKVFSLRDNKNRDPAGHSGQHRVWTIGGRGSFIDHTDCCRPTSGSGSNTWSQPARRPAHQTSRSYPGVEKVARKSEERAAIGKNSPSERAGYLMPR